MQDLSGSNLQIATNAAAGFASRSRKVIDSDFAHGKAAEDHVAIHGATQLAGLTNAIVIACGVRQVLRLVLFFARAFEANYFLQSYYVGPKLIQHFSYS